MPESIPAAITTIDQMMRFVADVRAQQVDTLRPCPRCAVDPGEWLSNKLLELRHNIVAAEALLVDA